MCVLCISTLPYLSETLRVGTGLSGMARAGTCPQRYPSLSPLRKGPWLTPIHIGRAPYIQSRRGNVYAFQIGAEARGHARVGLLTIKVFGSPTDLLVVVEYRAPAGSSSQYVDAISAGEIYMRSPWTIDRKGFCRPRDALDRRGTLCSYILCVGERGTSTREPPAEVAGCLCTNGTSGRPGNAWLDVLYVESAPGWPPKE